MQCLRAINPKGPSVAICIASGLIDLIKLLTRGQTFKDNLISLYFGMGMVRNC